MRYSTGRPNNGYLGKNSELTDLQGVISNNKHYKTFASIEQFYGPTYWLNLPNIQPNEQRFAGLLAIYKGASGNTGTTADSNFVAFVFSMANSGHSYFVDWGDGNTGRFRSGLVAQYQYNWENISSSTETPEGYKQVLIQAYPQTGGTFTALDMNQRFSGTGITYPSQALTPWLDIALCAPALSSFLLSGGNTRFYMLKRWRFIGSFPNLTSASFNSITQLQNISGLDGLFNITTTNGMFSGIRRLRVGPAMDTRKVTNFQDMFNSTSSMRQTYPYDTSKGITMPSMFSACWALESVPKFNTSNARTANSFFSNCLSLRTIPEMDFSLNTNFDNMFVNCFTMIEMPPINTNSGITFTSMFNNCQKLTKLPSGLNTTNAISLSFFTNTCFNLREFPGLTTSNCRDFTAIFQSSRMETLPKLHTSNGITFTNAFNDAKFLTVPDLDVGKGLCFGNGFAGANAIMAAPLLNTRANISYADCTLSPTALNQIFTNLASVTGGQIITITNNWGSSGCNRSIATGKGWTVTG